MKEEELLVGDLPTAVVNPSTMTRVDSVLDARSRVI